MKSMATLKDERGNVIDASLVDVFEMCEVKAEDGQAPGM
jgi:hypothetical protein